MIKLQDLVQNETARAQLINLCAELIEHEVNNKSGLSGLALKTTYSVVKSIKPNMVSSVLESLLGECVRALQPFVTQALAEHGRDLIPFFSSHASTIAETLLAITDKRAEHTTHAMLRKAYEKLRPTGLKNVETAIPGLAQVLNTVLSKHL
jgi:hypothetical protein